MATSAAGVERAKQGNVVANWKYVLATTNPPRGRLDPVSKWLYLTRAGVLPMTLVSAAVAGLLAVYRERRRRVGLVRARGDRASCSRTWRTTS